MPTGQSVEAIAELFAKIVDKTADITIGVPDLIRTYFGHSDDLRSWSLQDSLECRGVQRMCTTQRRCRERQILKLHARYG
jgi:hypothetical protein